MSIFRSRDEVLDYAIEKESEAEQFYADWAARVDKPIMRVVLMQFSQEEASHKRILKEIKEEQLVLLPDDDEIESFQLADLSYSVPPSPDMTFAEALIIAMKREKESFEMYMALAGETEDEGLKKSLLTLAQEEARHKLHFECEYDAYLFEHKEDCQK